MGEKSNKSFRALLVPLLWFLVASRGITYWLNPEMATETEIDYLQGPLTEPLLILEGLSSWFFYPEESIGCRFSGATNCCVCSIYIWESAFFGPILHRFLSKGGSEP